MATVRDMTFTFDESLGATLSQWDLNRRNFAGRWCGTSHWHLRDAGTGVLDLQRPTRTIHDTCYAIDFSDDDTGVWDGRGLLFAPDGRRRLPLSRATYNSGGSCWQFAGAGGQSSLAVDDTQPRFGHEVNLFFGRSRSMLVLLWSPEAGAGDPWRLDAVGAVAFRCTRSAIVDPPRPQRPVASLLADVEGWAGQLEALHPHRWPADDPAPVACGPFRPAEFARHPLTAAFADGLVCSVPEVLPAAAFRLEVGCRMAPDHFEQLSLVFDDERRLQAWERRRFRPVGD